MIITVSIDYNRNYYVALKNTYENYMDAIFDIKHSLPNVESYDISVMNTKTVIDRKLDRSYIREIYKIKIKFNDKIPLKLVINAYNNPYHLLHNGIQAYLKNIKILKWRIK